MSIKVVSLSETSAHGIFNLSKPNTVMTKLYSRSDLAALGSYEAQVPTGNKIINLFRLFWFYIFHLKAVSTFFHATSYHPQNLLTTEPVRTNLLKSGLAAYFQPKSILEIGTYLGWGAAAFKTACHKSRVYTINPRIDTSLMANNPIRQELIGKFFRDKKMAVNQLWGDSAIYDYSDLPIFDVVCIDGDHKYQHVLKDLVVASNLATKAIIVDDYIPTPKVCPKRFIYGYWTHEVTSAVNDFLLNNSELFKNVYWIVDSKICLLIKK